MNLNFIWARLIYSLPIAFTGLIYLLSPQETVESLTSFIPGDIYLIHIAGFFWLCLGFMVACNLLVKWASLGLVMLGGAFLVMVHIPAAFNGEHLLIVWFELLRELSLMGAGLLIFNYYGQEKYFLPKQKTLGQE